MIDMISGHQQLLREFRKGNATAIHNILDRYSMDELEELGQLENAPYNEWEHLSLYRIIMYHRKKRLNEQFVFNQGNVNAILHKDMLFKKCCQQLLFEAENEYNRLLEQKKVNANTFFFHIDGSIRVWGDNSFIDCLASYDNSLFDLDLTGSTHENSAQKELRKLPIFDFATNYVDKIIDNSELATGHVGYAFYKFYSESFFSLQDILEIKTFEAIIIPHLRYQQI